MSLSKDFEEFIACLNERRKLLVIGRDDLIANKRATGRAQDNLDVEQLLSGEE